MKTFIRKFIEPLYLRGPGAGGSTPPLIAPLIGEMASPNRPGSWFFLRVALASLLLAANGTLFAQNDSFLCGTEASSEQIAYMTRTREARQRFQIDPASRADNNVPITAHIVRRSNGTGGLSEAQLNNALAVVNGYYQNANISFYLCGPINYINSDTYYNFNANEEVNLRNTYNVANTINIYFVEELSSSTGSPLCGYAYFPGGPDLIMMRNSCTTSGNTFAHEIGHYFSLFHTHGKSNCGISDELVSGANCANAGDDVCDTPADPNLRGNGCATNLVSNCNYIGSLRDANGQLYNPDVRNIMSYAPGSCRTLFSQGQYNRIAWSLANERNYLTCNNPPDSKPDYTITAMSSSTNPITPGQNFTVNATLANQGATAYNGSDSRTTLYLSTNSTLDGSDVALTPAYITPSLTAGNSGGYNFNGLVVPTNVSSGNYYLIMYVDNNNTMDESNENNNTRAIQVSVGGGNTPKPDYTITAMSSSTNPITPGQDFTVNATLANQGAAAYNGSDSRTTLYLSTNSTLDGSDVALTPAYITPSLTAGNSGGYNFNGLVVPTNVSSGNYYLIMYVDNNNAMDESNENNNTRAIQVSVGGGNQQPDYIPVDFRINGQTSLSVSPGEEVSGSLFARNQGSGPANRESSGKYYFSTDNNLSSNDQQIGVDNIEALSPGQQTPETETVTIPGNAPLGTRYIFYKVDADDQISESNEGNNVARVTINVTGTPPNANFTASSRSICQGEVVPFSNQSTGSPTSYVWTFSPNTVSYVNGTSPTSANPQVRFAAGGSYTVSLRASNASGSDTETKSGYISVSNSITPSVSIIADRNNICPGERITLTASVNGGGNSPSYQWMVNGSNVGTGPTYTSSNFNNGDQVRLMITSSSSCASPRTATSNTVIISVEPNCGGPNWPVTPTGDNHTVIVETSTEISIDGMPIMPGDYLGVYFVDGGVERYAGKARWTGQNISVTVYGDDNSTNPKDGYRPGEVFTWRLWKATTGDIFEGTATYRQPNGLITHTDQYAVDGLSSLASLEGSSEQSQALLLQPGWNMVSTYIEVDNPSVSSIFSPIQNAVGLVKNGAGQIYFPSGGINAIGNWQITQGYKVRILGNTPQRLEMRGRKVNPASNPINLSSGWNLIAYLSDQPQGVAQALSSISDRIVLVKNNAGDIYSPVFGINNIGSLQPGQGYQVNMSSAGVLRYGTTGIEGMGRLAPSPLHRSTLKATHYTHAFRAGANASFILHESSSLEQGDEIGVFSSEGALVGSAVYEGHALAFPIWGAERDGAAGLKSGEAFQLRVWREGRELAGAMVEYLSPAVYEDDAVIEARLAGFQAPNSVQLFPNPARGQTTLSMVLSAHTEVAIELYTVTGQLIRRVGQSPYEAGRHEVALELAGLPEGLYQLRVMLDKERRILRLSVAR